MIQILEQTQEEKFKMYNKLSKKELILMLIEANKHLKSKPLQYAPSNQITVGDLCGCNTANGGSGICQCTIGNEPIDSRNYEYKTDYIFSNTSINLCNCGKERALGEHYCPKCLNDNPLLCN